LLNYILNDDTLSRLLSRRLLKLVSPIHRLKHSGNIMYQTVQQYEHLRSSTLCINVFSVILTQNWPNDSPLNTVNRFVLILNMDCTTNWIQTYSTHIGSEVHDSGIEFV